jgi:lipoprotein NlpI
MRAYLHEQSKAYAKAISDFDEAIRLMPTRADLYDRRGGARFKLGRIEASIADFDKAIELDPAREPEHWQRGISYYYAGRFEDGWKQFDIHQTVNPNDVENSVWRFLCMTRAVGVERAREEMLAIRGDRRIPMTEVLALCGGKGTVEEVLAAAGDPSPARRRQQLFYAHFYIGLFYEAMGKAGLAREHIERADREFSVDHYMGDVARVHAARLKEAAEAKPVQKQKSEK